MATVITSECINCGACEPECPNTAIYQGGVEWELDGQTHAAISNDIFYIVPEKCTECVGFFDHEACAAVCPVDCCVPDPKIPESEAVLLERAKKLHPETSFAADFPSRFRKDGGAATAAPAADAPPAAASSPAPVPAAPRAAVEPAPAEPVPGGALPTLDDWEIPILCRECDGEYTVAFQYLRPGVVFYCPHCQASFVPTRTTYLEIATALERFQGRWERAFAAFEESRHRELAAFEERQRAELAEFEQRLRSFTHEGQTATGTARRRWFN
ncbi:MAG: 4Fe-4S dicluster domain-containing protein [Deltaproteobacteria bacterium]|nr:4Fe-4S dicluster domain-containing protein [Deltaproteobacteria bacterium]